MEKKELIKKIKDKFEKFQKDNIPKELIQLQEDLDFDMSYKGHNLQLISEESIDKMRKTLEKLVEFAVEETIKYCEAQNGNRR